MLCGILYFFAFVAPKNLKISTIGGNIEPSVAFQEVRARNPLQTLHFSSSCNAIGCSSDQIRQFSKDLYFIRLKPKIYYKIILARTAEIGQDIGRILSSGARKPEQT